MIIVYCDGACEPRNPGGWGVGGWVARQDDVVLTEGTIDCGESPDMTNNIAEYAAVKFALSTLASLGHTEDDVTVYTDSKLVVEQLNDNWSCGVRHLRELRDHVWNILERFTGEITFCWVSRKDNKEADEISRSLYPRE